MALRFSRRTRWDLSESSLSAAVRAVRAAGREVIDLTRSNPTRCGFDYDAANTLDPLSSQEALVYDPEPRGLPSARLAVSDYYRDAGAQVEPDHVILTTSTSEAYSFVFRLLCDPDDEVLIAEPGYPLFNFLADLDDVRLRTFPMYHDHGWWIDLAALEQAISPRTKAVLLVNPSNPTGNFVSAPERLQIEAICERHGLALIVDEVFLDYALEPGRPAPSFAVGPHPGLTFVLSGLSKVAALPQMKVAWIACFGPDAASREALTRLEVIADTFLSLNAPAQLALPLWLKQRTSLQQQILARTRRNLTQLRERSTIIHVLRVDAGWSAILCMPQTFGQREVVGQAWRSQADCVAEAILAETAVLVHPGSFYGIAERGRVVISLITPPADLSQGIERLQDLSRKHLQE